MNLDDDFGGRPLIDTLLTPTRIYVKEFKANRKQIKALAHITGGGIVENLPRVLPENLKAKIYRERLKPLPIFELLGKYVAEDEMYRTFNMGVGMIIVADSADVDSILANSDGYVIGEIVKGKKGVELI